MARRRCNKDLVASTRKLFRSIFRAVPGKRTMKAAVKSAGKLSRKPFKLARNVTKAATRRVRKFVKY